MPSAIMQEQLITQFVVGKIDAGLSMLLTDDLRVIEFPSVLLPESVGVGSVVQVQMLRNEEEEKKRQKEFEELQELIKKEYGKPVSCKNGIAMTVSPKNVTQTTVTVEWNEVELRNCELRGIDCFVNGSKATSYIMHKTNVLKLNGLDMQKEYKIQIVIRTSGGTLSSQVLNVVTHGLTEMSGVVLCIGSVSEEDKQIITSIIQEFGVPFFYFRWPHC